MRLAVWPEGLIRSRQIVIDGAICGRCIYRELLSHHREHIQQNDQTPRPRIFDRNSRHGGSGKSQGFFFGGGVGSCGGGCTFVLVHPSQIGLLQQL